jgi:deoxycytidine triphosphate deaminase
MYGGGYAAQSPQMMAAMIQQQQQQMMQSYGQTGVAAYTPQQQQQMMIQQQALALQQQQQQQRAQQQQTGYGQSKPAMHRPALAPPPQPAAVARPPVVAAKPASAAAHLNINGMLSDGTLSIKPFSPHMLSVEHNVYFLKLGDTFYRAAPRIPLANPYDPEGPYNGLTEKPRHAVEWSEIREKLVAAETERGGGGDRTAAEAKIDTVFRPSVIAPTDRAILLNPLETIVAHTDECIAFPEDCLPVVEAASCMS